MTTQEIIRAAIDYAKTLNEEDVEVAIRYDNKRVSLGEVLQPSKSNFNCEDLREFPDFESDEYASLEEMPGTSAYSVCNPSCEDLDNISSFTIDILLLAVGGKDETPHMHCSIVTGHDTNWSCEDVGEICLSDCTVAKVLW
jgi:hypothetical protein